MNRSVPFSLLVKPAGADCNLNCGYCFYLKKAGLYPGDSPPRISFATVEKMLKAYFATTQRTYSFGWQGGEPTLMGVEFFREVFEMQRRLAPAGSQISNGLQTNGTLLTPEWAHLFREYNVLVGLSIDGPAELHNTYRRWADREGEAIRGRSGDTHQRVETTARLLREEKVAYNALTVVGRHNQEYPIEVYEYLRSLRIRHMQLIPLIEWERGTEEAATGERGTEEAATAKKAATRSDFSVTPLGWGRFLKAIFDRWFPKDVRRVSIRHHDSVIEYLLKGEYNVCTMSEACGGHFVVEHTGDIYPCDFYVEPELCLGNVNSTRDENPFLAAFAQRRYDAFQRQKRNWVERCSTCRYRALCGGDCPKMRPPEGGLSALCDGWIDFYDYTIARFERLSRAVAPDITGHAPVKSGFSPKQ